MTTYTAIPDSDIDPDSPGTTGLFTLLRNNPVAIMEKASGAPVLANNYILAAMINADAVTTAKIQDGNVTKAKLASASVVQGKIETLTGSHASSVGAQTRENVVMNPYCFFPHFHASDYHIAMGGHSTDSADADVPQCSATNYHSADSASFDMDWRYIVS